MSYSESLANRIRRHLAGQRGVAENQMFGCVGFLLHGNVCVAVWNTSLVARLGNEQAQLALREPYARDFDITGRAMRGWVVVDAEGVETDAQLQRWIDRCVTFVQTLPKKDSSPRRGTSARRKRG